MKNIHILPTDKPSRLHKTTKNIFLLATSPTIKSDLYKTIPQNIYITNLEEIKEGVNQWYLDKVLNKPYNSGGAQYYSKQDVIILTDNKDLIDDGVQAIDDEFLEWFIKNSSCEDVKVDKHWEIENWYRTIIPKEEPKQEYESECICDVECKGFTNVKCKKPTQETTLEEAAENYTKDGTKHCIEKTNVQLGFIEGVKWQAERSYSEEEVKTIINDIVEKHCTYFEQKLKDDVKLEWFNQF